jgi:nucleotide-binding universal stress UspA family protein
MSVIAELSEIKQKDKLGFARILFATDFSDVAQRAFTYAAALASRYGSELFIVHAIEPEPRGPVPLDPLPRELDRMRLDAERQMKRFIRAAKLNGRSYQAVVRRGEVWDVLSSLAEREHIDLLVLGTHGRKGLAKLALGSVAEHVVHVAACPVLTVGPNVPPADSGAANFATVLFAVDFGAASVKALPYAIRIAEDCRSQLVLLHMLEPIPVSEIAAAAYGPPILAAQELEKWQSTKKHEVLARLKKLIPAPANLATAPMFETTVDLLPEGILESAKAQKADLIVMGTNRTDAPRLASHLPWALISEVIRKAKCPVLTVRN